MASFLGSDPRHELSERLLAAVAHVKLETLEHLGLQSHQVGAELLKARISYKLAEDFLVEVVEMLLFSFVFVWLRFQCILWTLNWA